MARVQAGRAPSNKVAIADIAALVQEILQEQTERFLLRTESGPEVPLRIHIEHELDGWRTELMFREEASSAAIKKRVQGALALRSRNAGAPLVVTGRPHLG